MKRPVIVWVDDRDVNEVGVQPLDLDAGVPHPMFYVPVPSDNQLTQDIDQVTSMFIGYYEEFAEGVTDLDDRDGDFRFARAKIEQARRLRAEFGLDGDL